jgi:hypothetical protein
MHTKRLSVSSMAMLAVMCLSSLNACVSMGVTSVKAGAALSAIASAAASQSDEDAPTDTEVRGNYETGFWFDRDFFFVWVTAHSADEAQRVARFTAMDSCSKRKKPLMVVSTADWQERRLFIPVTIDRFSYEIRFRCAAEVKHLDDWLS